MYECFHCGHRSVVWQSDCTFEEVGAEGEGIVHFCQCSNCGAWIEYYVPIISEEGQAVSLEEANGQR